MATEKRKKSGTTKSESAQPAISPADQPPFLSSLQRLGAAKTIILICLFSFLAYANSLGGDFVRLDDADQVVENQNIRSWNNLEKAFTTHVWAFRDQSGTLNAPPPLPYYRPLFTVMLTVEYHVFGLWPQGWHLVSLLLHILCSIGVFYVILRMSGRNLVALFASILFAVHPVHAESVSWISGMTDPLFGVFFLSSLAIYLKARGGDRGQANRKALMLSLAIFVLAAFAKETALSLVMVIFGYEAIEGSGRKTERMITAAKRAIPFACAALIYLAPRYLVLGELMWKNPQAPDRPLAYTLLTLPFVIFSYVGHLLWPIDLSVTYATHFVTSAASARFLVPAAALVLSVGALLVYRKRVSREVWLALLLIFVPLLPVLNLGQVSQEEYLVFDHYLYLSVAGVGYLVALGVVAAGGIESKARRPLIVGLSRSAVAAAAFFVMALALTAAAARENRPWADSYSLWSNVTRIRPTYWAAHYNLGLVLLEAKRFDEARASLERATALKPDEPNALDALGRSYDETGETPLAVASFKRAIDLDPMMFESRNNLGTVYFKNKDYASAEASFAAAIRLKPGAVTVQYNLGLCYARQGRYVDATRELERVVQATPDDALALYELGLCYERIGRIADAARIFQTAEKSASSRELADRLNESLVRLRGEGQARVP